MSTRYCPRCLTTFGDAPSACPNLGCGRDRPPDGWGRVLAPGDLLDRHYRIERPLAVGGAGITYLAREVDGDGAPRPPDLAVKVLYTARASGPFLRRLANEAQILRELHHEHIVDCRGFVHRDGQEPYLVTLFEQGGSLADHLARVGPLSPGVAAGVLRQVLMALDVAHQRGVVHRDLKPDNVLLRSVVDVGVVPQIRVADFGIAKVTGALGGVTKIGAFVGTPEYAAPEQFQGQRASAATDVFAVGGLLVFLLTGEAPVRFTQRTDPEACLEELLAQVPPRLSAARAGTAKERAVLQGVLDGVMVAAPDRRWTVQQTLQALQPLMPSRPRVAYSTLELTDRGAPHREVEPSSATFVTEWTEEEPKLGGDDELVAPARTEWVRNPPSTDASGPPPEAPVAAGPPAPVAPPEPPPSAPREVAPTPRAPTPMPPEPEPQPAPPPRRQGGCLAAAAGVLGLGVAGAGVVGVGGGAVAVVTVVVAAWAFGWFGGGGPHVTLAERVVDTRGAAIDAGPHLLGSDDPAWRELRREVQRALDADAGPLGRACGAGPVVVSVALAPDGAITAARAHAADAACVERALVGRRLPNPLGRAVVARVGLYLGG